MEDLGIGPWEIAVILLALAIALAIGRVRVARAVSRRSGVPATSVAPSPPAVMCPNCQTANSATNKFCSSCGSSLKPEAAAAGSENTCPSCATVNPPGQAFCGQCGTRLTVAA